MKKKDIKINGMAASMCTLLYMHVQMKKSGNYAQVVDIYLHSARA